MRRWLLRILLSLLILLILAAAAVQIVLATSVPHNLVLAQVQRTLRLRMTAESLDTGWSGHTTLRNVTLSLPLASESFLTVKTLRVRHTILPAILVGRSVQIDSMEFDEPELLVRQSAATGRWNVADVFDLLRRVGGGEQAAQTAEPHKPENAQIPGIVIRDGTIRIIDRLTRTAIIDSVNIHGAADGPLVWRYDAAAGGGSTGGTAQPYLHLLGKLAPGGTWRHEVEITASRLDPWDRPWLTDRPAAVRAYTDSAALQATWTGAVNEGGAGGVSGLLAVADLRAGPITGKGALAVSYESGTLRARPIGLTLSGIPRAPSDIKLTAGEFAVANARISASALAGTLAGGDVRLTADYDWNANTGHADAQWNRVAAPSELLQSGSLVANFRQNFNVRRLDAQLTTQATSRTYGWNAEVALESISHSMQAIDWQITARRLDVTRDKFTANLDGLQARFQQGERDVSLTELTVPAGQLAPNRPRGTLQGRGHYAFPSATDAGGGDWWLSVSGADWRLSEAAEVKSRFSLDATGDLNAPHRQDWARVGEFYADTSNGLQFWATGSISYRAKGMPVNGVSLDVWYPPFSLDAYDAGQVLRAGQFVSRVSLDGGLWPLNLAIRGHLDGKDVFLRGNSIGDVSLSVAGTALAPDVKQPAHYEIRLGTEHLRVFEGDWDLAAHYAAATNTADLTITLDSLELARLDKLIAPPPRLAGTATGRWTINAPQLKFAQARIDSDGPWKIEGFHVGEQFSADSMTGEIHADNGNVRLTAVQARRRAGGEIDASAEFRLRDPSQIKLTAIASAWPLSFADVTAIAYGQASDVSLDLKAKRYTGPFKFDLYPVIRTTDAGALHAQGRLAGRVIELAKIEAQSLSGGLTGYASYDLDDLLKARADLTLDHLDAAQLAQFIPQTRDLSGRISGSMRLGPTTQPRPIGPLELRAQLTADAGHWRTIALRSADLSAFYDPGLDTAREERLILDNSYASAAGGDLRLFARLTRHPSAAVAGAPIPWSYSLLIDGARLNLNQLTHAVHPAAKDTPGLLQANIRLAGSPQNPRRFNGDGTLRLTEADLADNAVISGLYALMSIKLGPKVPVGAGYANFRIDGDNLDLVALRYFNRGVEVRGSGQVRNVWLAADAPIDAYVVGSVRPLKDLKIPFAADLDKVINAIQQNSTIVHVRGTVAHPEEKVAAFTDIGTGLRSLILGDVSAETRSTAGQ